MLKALVYSIYSLTAFFVTGAPVAYGTEATASTAKTVEVWQRQENVDKAAKKGGLLTARGSKPPLDKRNLKMGGPGMDGGGGSTVLLENGQVRMLDLAVAEKARLKRFDKKDYAEIMTRNGSTVSNVGTVISNSEFFACATQKLTLQDNLLLQYLRPENIQLYVVLTELPLVQSSHTSPQVVFQSPLGTGYAYQAQQLPEADLFSSSVPTEYQRPVASYAFQAMRHNIVPRQVLLVSSQLYNALSKKDRCALQVHELLRYVANFGKTYSRGVPLLVKRSLSTKEIEILTDKIVHNQQVYLSEIPATNFYKFLSIRGSALWTANDSKALQDANIYSLEDDNDLSLGEASVLYEMIRLSDEGNKSFEEGSLELGRHILQEQTEILRGKVVNIQDILN